MSDKNKSKRPHMRVFFLTAFITFLLFIMGAGFLIADYNSRKMAFGNGSLRIDVYTEKDLIYVNMLGREQKYVIHEQVSKWTGRIWNLLPPGVRAVFWVFESECDAVPEVLE